MLTATKINRCACGKRIAKYATKCKACYEARHTQCVAEARAIVATGKCPTCGAGLKRLLALSGWWTCEQRGAEGFRKDASKPSCSFQTFTE